MAANNSLTESLSRLCRAIQFRRRLVINGDDGELIEGWREQFRVSNSNMSLPGIAMGIEFTLRNRGVRPKTDLRDRYIHSVSVPFNAPLVENCEGLLIPVYNDICLGFIHSPDFSFVSLRINGVKTLIPRKTFQLSVDRVFTAIYSHNLSMGVHYIKEAIFCDTEGTIVDLGNGVINGVFCFIEGVFNDVMRVDKDVFECRYRRYILIQAAKTIQRWYKSCKQRETLDEVIVVPPPSYESIFGFS